MRVNSELRAERVGSRARTRDLHTVYWSVVCHSDRGWSQVTAEKVEGRRGAVLSLKKASRGGEKERRDL